MLDAFREHVGAALFAATYGALLVVAIAELALERRSPIHSSVRRWSSNFALSLINRAVVRAAVPLGAFAVAAWSAQREIGLLHALALPPVAAAVIAVVLLDLTGYVVHRLEHAVPVFWRLHRVHHADVELDFSTSQRHHPLSAILANSAQFGVVAALGVPPLSLAAYFLLRQPIDAFAHGNLRLPRRLDRAIRWLFVTPGMHVVHHSAAREETDTNFAEIFPVWDRLFGTYREAPALGEAGMTIGLEAFRTPRDLDLDRLLLQPLRSDRPAVNATA